MNISNVLITSTHWKDSLKNYEEALRLKVKSKKNSAVKQEFIEINLWYVEEYPKIMEGRRESKNSLKGMFINKEELANIVMWKLNMGHFRPHFMKRVMENEDEFIQECSLKSFEELDKLKSVEDKFAGFNSAIKCLSKLYGIGPTTATAILAPFHDMVPFMSDEIIWFAFRNNSAKKRLSYDKKELHQVFELCKTQAELLNKEDGLTWTSDKVQKAVWSCTVRKYFHDQLQAKWDHEDSKKRKRENEQENIKSFNLTAK
jgi:hypothetical protein